MKYKSKLTIPAKEDLKTVVVYYESKRSGLGKEFLEEFKQYKKMLSDIVTARFWYESITAIFCQYKNPDRYSLEK